MVKEIKKLRKLLTHLSLGKVQEDGFSGRPKAIAKYRRAFTLVELLIVIAIIGILAGMLLPALENARDAAKIITCANNEKQIILAIIAYANDSRGYFPNRHAFTSNTATHNWNMPYCLCTHASTVTSNPATTWDNSYNGFHPNYIADPNAFFCPAMDPSLIPLANNFVPQSGWWGLRISYQVWYNIGYASSFWPTNMGGPEPIVVNSDKRLFNNTSNRVLMTDFGSPEPNAAGHYLNGHAERNGGGFNSFTPTGLKGMNFGYVDGHVKWEQLSTTNGKYSAWGWEYAPGPEQ